MSTEISLFQRRRPLTAQELDVIPWLRLLSAIERERAVEDLKISAIDGTHDATALAKNVFF